ncbi:MAG TPA: MFS transporter [Terrimesophilobacter sp.]|nr:MFS transporter [Terrimesophilobacter sp.]
MPTVEPLPFRFRSIALPAILPTLAFSIGEGAIIPIIPIVAHNLGAQLAIAGLVTAMLTIGQLFGDIPSGWVISRIGERAAMIYACVLSVAGLTLAMLSTSAWLLGVAVFLIGLATAVFALARQAFMTTFVPLAYRARALSTLGGSFRLGFFIGPFMAAAVIHLTGSTQSAFWVHVTGCVVAAALLVFLKDPEVTFRSRRNGTDMTDGEALLDKQSRSLLGTIAKNRGVLVRLGTGAALISAVRASRQVIVPLWAVSIGVSDANTALIIGIAGGLDFALFYTTGQIMDRWGRMWTALPSMIGLGLGHLALAFTHDVPAAVTWFIAITMVLGVANGFGSGLLMTLGADLADPKNPAPFLGAFRFTSDVGGAASPLALSALTALVSLPFAGGVMGVIGLVGAAVLWRYLPRYVPRTR